MSDIFEQLLGGNPLIIVKLLKKLLKGVKGSLDGEPFDSVSPKSSKPQNRLIKLKGWVVKNGKEQCAVSFRVKIGQLSDAVVMYDPDMTGWQDTDEGEIKLDYDDGEFILKFDFTDEAGKKHEAEFTAKL